ncbi:hypothetical protein HBH70_049900 [Parastagonospora nodorum]|nr:hypothetical protein HBH52_055880 [Parastagonospora nodorum]KAH4096273.1 hypothetical protein HBH46_165570 [Parastagonospora nodorum]KAH4212277.1 hypothetical protein HBI95_035260 [Parastagonospora nodorum]KAH4264205.1 hypothetical protein HBI04_187390 [Parastagonospora nodorum]KAH4270485.1 hypothetical protein HBI03_045120 [Parastagonospora nodorum]
MVDILVVQRSGQSLLAVADLLQYNAQVPLDSTMLAYTEAEKALKALTGTLSPAKSPMNTHVIEDLQHWLTELIKSLTKTMHREKL